MKRLLAITGIVSMIFGSACEETTKGESDASVSESCVLCVAPRVQGDAGESGKGCPAWISLEATMKKAPALKLRCGDDAEVRIEEGALSEERLGVATSALRSQGVKVNLFRSGTDGSATGGAGQRDARKRYRDG